MKSKSKTAIIIEKISGKNNIGYYVTPLFEIEDSLKSDLGTRAYMSSFMIEQKKGRKGNKNSDYMIQKLIKDIVKIQAKIEPNFKNAKKVYSIHGLTDLDCISHPNKLNRTALFPIVLTKAEEDDLDVLVRFYEQKTIGEPEMFDADSELRMNLYSHDVINYQFAINNYQLNTNLAAEILKAVIGNYIKETEASESRGITGVMFGDEYLTLETMEHGAAIIIDGQVIYSELPEFAIETNPNLGICYLPPIGGLNFSNICSR